MAKRVYLEYDQRALDAEYNNREKVTDSADWISRYAIASAETRATFECRLDLAYGTHPGETLDVFPARSAPAPVHVFVHGGYWQRLDKADSPKHHHFSILAELEDPGSTLSRLLLRSDGLPLRRRI
jgi:acetyl esterase/lipase